MLAKKSSFLNWARIVFAALIAPVFSVLPSVVSQKSDNPEWTGWPGLLILLTFETYVLELIALPFFIFFRLRGKAGLVFCLVTGFLLSALEIIAVRIMLLGRMDEGDSGGDITLHGHLTHYGYFATARDAAFSGGSGLILGFMFWLIGLYRMSRRQRTETSDNTI